MSTISTKGTLHLNIIWHQHQPLYLDSDKDQLQGPWVRTHGTKDYYDMAAMLKDYPDVHCTFNLTSSLLWQLERYYIDRLKPFVNVRRNRINTDEFLTLWQGKTDPWIDLALKPTNTLDEHDLRFLLYDPWNALHITEVMIGRFPAYMALKEKVKRREHLSEQELREIKFWFFLAYFDPDFLEKKILLEDGITIDLTDLVTKTPDGMYILKKMIAEDDCNRIVAEMYKVMVNIIPIHQKLMQSGQIDITTTPFYHPILPLVYDNDLARVCQPNDSMPNRFQYPQDAHAQVAKAVTYFKDTFGQEPLGMWPSEGSVAHEVVTVFSKNGIQWIATDEKILTRSKPEHLSKCYPYRVGKDNTVAIVFRDTELSDKIAFAYQHFKGEDAAMDFVQSIMRYSSHANEPDRLVTVILDGENAWEWYRYENDGKGFLHALYRKLSRLFQENKLITVTMSEYIHGNKRRGVSPHPISSMREIEWLYPGSWINAKFDMWIGHLEKNQAWNYLLVAREDLESSGLPQPDPHAAVPTVNTRAWYSYQAWEAMYAAEGSDWFWWYGTQHSVPGGTKPFDLAFIRHLKNIYEFAKLAGGHVPNREFIQIVTERPAAQVAEQGVMVQHRRRV
ncbi:MAG: hypothetical protein HY707_10915 [Ignavibacteriae bacterium]|nr:hypothetical protein [Ignavibacteriota bacterium]